MTLVVYTKINHFFSLLFISLFSRQCLSCVNNHRVCHKIEWSVYSVGNVKGQTNKRKTYSMNKLIKKDTSWDQTDNEMHIQIYLFFW